MSLKEFIYFYKKRVILICILILMSLLILCCFYYKKYYDNDGNIDFNNDLVGNDLLSDLDEKEQDYLPLCFFDIKGEVVKPGVYSIECDKRINDAILLSGGLTKNSDTSVLNLSKKIEDGMVIIVYSKKEVLNYLETLEKEEKKNSLCNSSNIVNDACDKESNINKNDTSTLLININTASLNELMTLTGIGESKAKNIISYRERTPFNKIEDILNVDGIGESIYVNIKKNITV